MKLNDGRENADYYRKENIRLSVQNKLYREAIEYVMSTKVNEHASVKNVVDDIKFILSEALEESE